MGQEPIWRVTPVPRRLGVAFKYEREEGGRGVGKKDIAILVGHWLLVGFVFGWGLRGLL
jgi:hypothetical protein